jgi:hypothetical protein
MALPEGDILMIVESIPAPCKVIFLEFGTETDALHVHEPAGTTTVSPSLAEFIAA